MKNKSILKGKCMEISLYTPNIFRMGLEVILDPLLFKTNKKVFFIFLDKTFFFKKKKLNISSKKLKIYKLKKYKPKKAQYKIKIYTCNTHNRLERKFLKIKTFLFSLSKKQH